VSRSCGGRVRARDDGIATVWAVTGVALIMCALLLGLHLGSAVAARHRAEAAADLAALAAAGLAVQGREVACARATEIAEAMQGMVVGCVLSGWDALVEVRVDVPLALLGARTAAGRARAGPAAVEPAGGPP
jgi:secretion/DNA translocation related TadE-like protein